MAQFFEVLSNVKTPIALAAVSIGILLFIYRSYLKSSEKKLELLPEAERGKSIDKYLTRYNIDGSNFTRDQKFQIIKQEMHKNHSWRMHIAALGALLLVIFFAMALVFYSWGNTTKNSSLVLRMKDEGSQIVNIKDPEKGSGVVYDFTLSNAEGGLVVVDSMAVEVLEAWESKYAVATALLSEYKFEATISPEKLGLVPFGKMFKYAPGDVDLISLNLSSTKPGYDYFLRIVINWYDAQTKEQKKTTSDIMVARFPPVEIDNSLSRDEMGRRYGEQSSKVQKRLEWLRKNQK